MTNGQSDLVPRQELRKRIESYLNEGRQCSQCLLLALKEVIGIHDEVLLGATRTLGRGMGGSGGVCGALTAGMLALGLASQGAGAETDLREHKPFPAGRTTPPSNDFLDTYTPTEPPVFFQCRELAVRFRKEVVPKSESVNCADISGVDWHQPAAMALSRYYAPGGGMARCTDLITQTAEIVAELVREPWPPRTNQAGKRIAASQVQEERRIP